MALQPSSPALSSALAVGASLRTAGSIAGGAAVQLAASGAVAMWASWYGVPQLTVALVVGIPLTAVSVFVSARGVLAAARTARHVAGLPAGPAAWPSRHSVWLVAALLAALPLQLLGAMILIAQLQSPNHPHATAGEYAAMLVALLAYLAVGVQWARGLRASGLL